MPVLSPTLLRPNNPKGSEKEDAPKKNLLLEISRYIL